MISAVIADQGGGCMLLMDKDNNEYLEITVYGEINIKTIKEFRAGLFEFAEKTDKDFILNLINVEYLDSSGIGVLIEVVKYLNVRNRTLKLENVNKKIKSLLSVSSLAELFAY